MFFIYIAIYRCIDYARTSVKLQFIGPTWDRVTDNAKVIIYIFLFIIRFI